MVLSVIYLFEIVCGIAGIVEKSKLDAILTNNLNKTFNNDESSEKVWKYLQSEVISILIIQILSISTEFFISQSKKNLIEEFDL